MRAKAQAELDRMLKAEAANGEPTHRFLWTLLQEWLVGDDSNLAKFAAEKLLERVSPASQRVETTYPEGIPAPEVKLDNSPDAIAETHKSLAEAGFFDREQEGTRH
jgi:hypothetical protein